MLNTRNEEKNTVFYSYLACLMNTFTLNIYVSTSYTEWSRRNTLFIFLWLRHRNTWMYIQHVAPPPPSAREGRPRDRPNLILLIRIYILTLLVTFLLCRYYVNPNESRFFAPADPIYMLFLCFCYLFESLASLFPAVRMRPVIFLPPPPTYSARERGDRVID